MDFLTTRTQWEPLFCTRSQRRAETSSPDMLALHQLYCLGLLRNIIVSIVILAGREVRLCHCKEKKLSGKTEIQIAIPYTCLLTCLPHKWEPDHSKQLGFHPVPIGQSAPKFLTTGYFLRISQNFERMNPSRVPTLCWEQRLYLIHHQIPNVRYQAQHITHTQ